MAGRPPVVVVSGGWGRCRLSQKGGAPGGAHRRGALPLIQPKPRPRAAAVNWPLYLRLHVLSHGQRGLVLSQTPHRLGAPSSDFACGRPPTPALAATALLLLHLHLLLLLLLPPQV